jgi:hypothetical protein
VADHNLPTTASTYADFVALLDARLDDITKWLDTQSTTPSNMATDSKRWDSAAGKWQRFNGTSWVDMAATYAISISGNAASVTNGVYTSGSYADPTWLTSLAGSKISGGITGNAGTATKLATARTINGVSFDGSANITVNASNSITFKNDGTGGATGTAFNGSAAKTISYNTIGAPKADGTGASGTWDISISGNAATATTSGACSGNAATATTSGACSGNAATATTASTATTATSAMALVTTNWTVEQSGTKLVFKYGAETVFSVASNGAVIAEGDIAAFGTA